MNTTVNKTAAPVKKEKVKEPFIHITKRTYTEPWKALVIRLLAIVFALIVSGLLIMIMTKLNPIEVYKQFIQGTFGSAKQIFSADCFNAATGRFWVTLQNTVILLCIALAITPAFKMRFWNLGAQGQVLVGGLASAACMFYLADKMPNWLMLLVMFAVSVLGGMIWAFIPAFFKAKWNTNETLFTLMMNYVAIQLVSFCIAVWVPSGSGVLKILNMKTKSGWLPYIFDYKYLLSALIVFVLTVIMFIYLKYTKHGYELTVVGESTNTAKYIGINVKNVIIRTVVFSGAICGLAGYLLVAGNSHTVSTGLDQGYGFTAVLVSWLSKFNPFIMVLASFLIAFLQKGAGQIAKTYQLDDSIADMLTGIILFFIIGCEFFINYKINFRSKSNKFNPSDKEAGYK